MNFSIPQYFSLVFVLVIGFTVHEFAHAWVADRLGDDTPYLQGRLTLNPLRHLDPVGSLMLLVFGFGWAKPVQVNPYTLERETPAGPMLVSLAGPLSNALLAVVAAIPLGAGLVSPIASGSILPSLYDFLRYFVFFNFVLAFFNLLPLFPLDGEKVLIYFLPPAGEQFMLNLRRYSIVPLILILWLLPFLGIPITNWLVFGPAQFFTRLFT
jgi:Zn-dependent protease